jgi:hypothetical protein
MRFIIALSCALFFSTAAQGSCYAQLKQRLPQAGTVIFGEMHGSAEIPKFFFDCAREFAAHGESFRVFLEFQASDNETVERFMRGEIDDRELIKAPHWSRQDGRASLAMLDLLRDLKALPGTRVGVFGFDRGGREADREKAMMENVLSAYSSTGYNLVLTGNIHARLARGMPWNPDLVPFARHLQQKLPTLVSLNARYPAGSAWTCSPLCEINPLESTDPPHRRAGDADVIFSNENPAYSGYFRVGSISASRPVIEK